MYITREWAFRFGSNAATRYELTIGELDPGVPKLIGIRVLSTRFPDGRYVEADEMSDRLANDLVNAITGLLSDPDFLRREVLT